MLSNIMNILGQHRKQRQFTLSQLSDKTHIDISVLSKYESGKRIPTDKHIDILSTSLEIDRAELNCFFQAERIAEILRYEPEAKKILEVAESRIEYLNSQAASIKKIVLNEEVEQRLFVVDNLLAQWNNSRPLKGVQLKKLNEYFATKYTYDSNQIEGNTLSYKETSLVINEGVTISGKSMQEHLEAINHVDAVHFMQDLVQGKEDLSGRTLLELHGLILKSIDQENAGRFRQVPVRISGSKHKPPEPYLVGKLMEDYFIYYKHHRKKLHPVILAAEMHERLVSIHPFIDGNGRTSRLVMNLILLKNGFTVTSLKGDDTSRLQYYNALEKVQLDNDPLPFYHLIIDRLMESLEEHLSLV